MPRSLVVIAGVSMSHMPVSLITQIGGELVPVGGEEGFEAGAADLLLAFHQHGDARRAGRPPPSCQARSASMNIIDLALVVHRAARDQALAVRAIDELRLERRAMSRAPAARPAARRSGRRTGRAAPDSRPGPA